MAPAPLRRPRKRRIRIGGRAWAAIGTTVLVLLVAFGAFLAYQNTLPTTLTANVKNGQKDVPTDASFLLSFSRPVSADTVKAAFSITPAAAGAITSVSGQTQYAWTPSKPLAELTTYTVDMKPIYDVGHHRVGASKWTFTTIIVPRVTSIAAADGTALKDGMEIDPGAGLKLTFNNAMEPVTIKVTVGGQVATLNWAKDGKSASFSTTGIPSGPLVVQMAPGGRDQTGHLVPAGFTLKTGIYWHDREHTIGLRFPALIQIPNDEFARDQNGLQAADAIFEYVAEGGITRLTAIYQNVPDLVGPMRSSRFISLKIARHYKGLLFQSGESQATRARAAQDPVPQFFDTIGYQYRTNARFAPDNLMINGDKVQSAESLYGGIPSFTVPKARPNLSGGTGGTSINVDEHYSTYTYDAGSGTYQKSEEGHPYQDASQHQPLRIEMLIVLHTRVYLLDVGDGHGAHIHDYDLDSNGHVEIFYKGQQYSGSWSSTDSHGPLNFTLDNGQPVSLPPGLVWIDVVS
ncbi:MAG TPA: DUF3048 domain-containing protein [Candidatus Dormibacteraeota bacterium]|nr:DUF3048 domain-containing protein [Candidatus Dormibacteraeota bacterium]